jgi:hypothetical protein
MHNSRSQTTEKGLRQTQRREYLGRRPEAGERDPIVKNNTVLILKG